MSCGGGLCSLSMVLKCVSNGCLAVMMCTGFMDVLWYVSYDMLLVLCGRFGDDCHEFFTPARCHHTSLKCTHSLYDDVIICKEDLHFA